MNPNLVRDLFEGLIVFAVGAITVSAIVRARRGHVPMVACPTCGRGTSRIYAACPYCRSPLGPR